MKLCDGAYTRVTVNSELASGFEDAPRSYGRDVLCHFLYADYLVLITEAIQGLRNMSRDRMVAFANENLKANQVNAKIVVSGSTTNNCLSEI